MDTTDARLEEAEDSADIFDTALCALFAVAPIGFSTSSAEEAHIYKPPIGDPVRLWLPHPPASVYAALQANNLWLSAVFFADKLSTGEIDLGSSSHPPPPASDSPTAPGASDSFPSLPPAATSLISSPLVAELGAGAGLPGIIAARGGARVVSSDYDDPEVVRTIRRNFDTEFGPSNSAAGWAVLGHSWGSSVAPLVAHAEGGFDAVLLADTIWSSDKHGILLDSVCGLLRRPKKAADKGAKEGAQSGGELGDREGGGDGGGVVHIAAGLHTGRGPIERFITLAEKRGLRATLECEVQWLPGGGWGPHAYVGGEGEERGVVVYHTLRWA